MKKLRSTLVTVLMLVSMLIVPVMAEDGAALDADIIIVGAGGAGITAAMEAVDAGASVILIEKTSNAGGNTNRASGGVDAAGTELQAQAGIEDSAEQFAIDMLRVGKNNDMDMVNYFTSQGQATIEFCKSIGFEFSPKIQIQYNDPARSHRDAENRSVGLILVPLLLDQLQARGIEIRYNEEATSLLQDESGNVTGVHVKTKGGEKDYHANAVILATGGFEGSAELMEKYAPQFAGLPTTGQSTNTGDGLLMAEAAGAELIHMEGVAAVNVEKITNTAPGVTVGRNGGLTVNSEGKLTVLEGVLEDNISWMIFNMETYENSPTLATYTANNVAVEADTIRELAKRIDIDPDALEATMDGYNTAFANKQYDDGIAITANINIAEKGPYFALGYAKAIHYTCGGIKVDVNTQVLRADGSAINGLYAAGETTGGLHGVGRYTGSSITEVIVFGRLAGVTASEYVRTMGHVEVALYTDGDAIALLPTGVLTDGTYTAVGTGMQGEMTLTAVVENGNVVRIECDGNETEVLFAAVEREIYPQILQKQSVEGIDAVTGATFASDAVVSAMAAIFAQAAR